MKVLFSHYLLYDDNPPERTVQALSRELRGLGHEVHVHRSFGPPPPGPVQAGQTGSSEGGRLPRGLKARVWFLKATLRNLRTYRSDAKILGEFRPDVVLCRHDPYCCSMALAASHAAVPLVLYADAPAAHETRLYHKAARWHPPGLVEAIERLTLRHSAAVTATSHPASRVLARYGVPRPTTVTPNGLFPESFPGMSAAERREALASLGIKDAKVLGFQGSFKVFHGIDLLREMMLATAGRDEVHWLLIGDGPELARLKAAVSGRVAATFLGRQEPESMGRLLSLIDVAVAPYQRVEGGFHLSPLKVIEYAAARCAVVTSDQGDIPWLLDDGRAGVLVSDPGPGPWVEAINRLLDDEPRRHALGEAARRHVLERFTWRRIAEQYETVLQSVAPRREGVLVA